MADYYPLVARAVAGLDKNTGEARRSLYERARTALVAQLRGVSPPLPESDVTRERLALEESIRRVEAEAARAGRSAQSTTASPRVPDRPAPPSLQELEKLGAELEQKLRRPVPPRLPPEPIRTPAQREQIKKPSASVFLSYSRADAGKVDKIVSDLKTAGHSVWIDRSGIDGGQAWRREIVAAIDASDVFVIALSEASTKSKMVIQELNYADEVHKPIVPLMLADVKLPAEMALQLSSLQRIDCTDVAAGAKALVGSLSKRKSRA